MSQENYNPYSSHNQAHMTNINKMRNAISEHTFELQYASALLDALNNGRQSGDRTGTGTKRIQSRTFYIDMSGDKFPILKGKKMYPKHAIVEAIWMFNGDTNTKFLRDNGVKYWDEWADKNGDLGPIYGKQIRDFGYRVGVRHNVNDCDPDTQGTDQLYNSIELIKNNPDSRRNIISLWDPNDLVIQKLAPCHILYQFCVTTNPVTNEKELDMHVLQRSADSFLGVPYDFILFGTMMKIVSLITNVKCGMMHYTCNDFHIYNNHIDQVTEYINNVIENKNYIIDNPSKMQIIVDRDELTNSDDSINLELFLKYVNNWMPNVMDIFEISGYSNEDCYGPIKAKIAV